MFWDTKIARKVLYDLVVDTINRSIKRTGGNASTRIVFSILFPN